MKKNMWTIGHIPLQSEKIAVVTGANSGLGFYTSRALALKGAKVIMACRSLERGEVARLRIMAEGAIVEPEVWQLDLASLESVRLFARKFTESGNRLDLLINNAGLMAIPYHLTADGFEMQFGVNHLGHFALTALLWSHLAKAGKARVVQVSSLAHYIGKIRFEDLRWEKGYKKWGAYGMSKLANLLFVFELGKRLKDAGATVTAAAAHPGYADTELQAKGARMKGSKLGAGSFKLINRLVAQSAEKGALPSLYAATAGEVKQGAYFGPGGLLKLRGWPAPDTPSPSLINAEVAGKLWKVSEELTGTKFSI